MSNLNAGGASRPVEILTTNLTTNRNHPDRSPCSRWTETPRKVLLVQHGDTPWTGILGTLNQ